MRAFTSNNIIFKSSDRFYDVIKETKWCLQYKEKSSEATFFFSEQEIRQQCDADHTL